jgi:FMN-dependent NADH-azoreductase
MNILSVFVSPFGADSTSRTVARELLFGLERSNPGARVFIRDLAHQPPPHWGAAEIAAAQTSQRERDTRARELLKFSDELCAELLESQILVIASPMWNFTVPSTLKAWIDHIVRAGLTFRYGDAGPIGLLDNLEKVYVIESTGGSYLPPPAQAMNHLGPYLNHLFKFLGAREVVTVSAPGTALRRDDAIDHARLEIQKLFE